MDVWRVWLMRCTWVDSCVCMRADTQVKLVVRLWASSHAIMLGSGTAKCKQLTFSTVSCSDEASSASTCSCHSGQQQVKGAGYASQLCIASANYSAPVPVAF